MAPGAEATMSLDNLIADLEHLAGKRKRGRRERRMDHIKRFRMEAFKNGKA